MSIYQGGTKVSGGFSKSPFQYAVEHGYLGTEDEFYANLANTPSNTIVQFTLSANNWVGEEAPYTYTLTGYDGKTVEVVEDVNMTMEQLAAIENAKIKSDPRNVENILYAFGDKPTIDVPVLLVVR